MLAKPTHAGKTAFMYRTNRGSKRYLTPSADGLAGPSSSGQPVPVGLGLVGETWDREQGNLLIQALPAREHPKRVRPQPGNGPKGAAAWGMSASRHMARPN
ncbi:Cation_ATPase_N domain-containing protein [Psidium guajava]|nr:Cation_ATPase_N domain-containing protein [Psidium guajava]